jgi:hypothetical protein
MASRRGSASKVINFNFDDLLETYLEYHGVVTASVFNDRHWAGNHDVTVYHPHGFLPQQKDRRRSSDIVFDRDGYLRIMASEGNNLWRPLLQTCLRSHTFIIIGLSGQDIHLQSLLHPLKNNHAICNERIAFSSVTFAERDKMDADIVTNMESWGVFTKPLDSWDKLPDYLFRICQEARIHRMGADNL